MEKVVQHIEAVFTRKNGIKVSGTVGGRRMSLEDMEHIAEEVGTKPDRSLSVAWPGQGHQHPEGKALCDAGVLKSSGSHGGGYPAVSGPRCKDFYDEVLDGESFEFLEKLMLEKPMAELYDGFTIKLPFPLDKEE